MKIGSIVRKRMQRKADKRRRKAIRSAQKARNDQWFRDHFPKLVVASGPFKGMTYPAAESIGSTVVPKLLGSYECELHEVLQRAFEIDYSEIVDVGCAEGYYAVGLGIRFPEATIYAFDTDPEALRRCRDMARLNGIDDGRLVLGDFCGPETLLNLPLTGRALIVVDCEGFEKQLFTRESPERLRKHDLIVEAHDFIDIEISTHLQNLFRATHDIQLVQSIDDIQKAKTYDYDELADCDLDQRRELLAEGRPTIMEWLIIRSRRVGTDSTL